MKIEYEIPVLYRDEFLIVVDKPIGLAVHKNDFMPHDAPYLTKLVGELTGCRIFNVHRLDARTSGVIVLAFSSEMAHQLTVQFERKEVSKKYVAVVQGNPGEGIFNKEVRVKKHAQNRMQAVTHYKTVETVELDIKNKENENVILSLVDIIPETGRWHQIRQHFAQNRFDIIGDTYHGNFSLNRIINELTGISRLLLHSSSLRMNHPHENKTLEISSPVPPDFRTVMNYRSF
jgi:tRNA pseudouridine65 synthase